MSILLQDNFVDFEQNKRDKRRDKIIWDKGSFFNKPELQTRNLEGECCFSWAEEVNTRDVKEARNEMINFIIKRSNFYLC